MTLSLALFVLVVALCLLCEGFFSGTETALISSDKTQLWAEARRGNRQALLAERILERSGALLSTTLVGTNLSVVTGTTFATLVVSHYVPREWESLVTTLALAPLILVFGEIVPKSLARANATALALRLAGALAVAQHVLRPIAVVVSRIAEAVLALLGAKPGEQSPYVTREELRAMAHLGMEHGLLVSDERRMILSVLELRDRPVSTVMVPLVEMASLPLEGTVADLEALAARRGYSRFPAYDGRVDNIVGVVRTLDVLNAVPAEERAARPLAPFVRREVAFVPETKAVGDLLRELRTSDLRLALVVEEHGGVVGLATQSDLIEEIVGRIHAPRQEQPRGVARSRTVFECDGTLEVEELAERLGEPIDKQGFETVAGLLMKLTGRIPQAGEELPFGPFRIEVLEADPRRVKRVRFVRTAPVEGRDEAEPREP
jgi:CBS domain containing-hemolysin-like protein